MKLTTALFLFVYGFSIGTSLTSCHAPPGAPTLPQRAISCSTEVVARDWARIYPAVMTCLAAVMTMPMTCLDAVPETLSVGFDVVACIVRTSGQEAASQQGVNPTDVVTTRKAERAAAWLDLHHVEFAQ